VLIVDGDLRKPSLHRSFGLKNDFGLAEVLEDIRPIDDYAFLELFQETDVDGLYLLAAGTGAANVAGMRYHERLAELMCRIRLEFQAVLIDTPPALEFSDARVLGGLSDAAILVFRAAETTRDAAAATLRRFEEDGIPVLGSVLNDLDPRDAQRHYGSYYRAYGAGSQTVEVSRG
jgi:Mrp family chromosome partitioning ATPase